MPLFWNTDKLIAGKYKLKKPIPVEFIPNYDDTDLYMFDKYIGSDVAENDDSEFLKELERILQYKYHVRYDGGLYNVDKDDTFREKLMEYLDIKD